MILQTWILPLLVYATQHGDIKTKQKQETKIREKMFFVLQCLGYASADFLSMHVIQTCGWIYAYLNERMREVDFECQCEWTFRSVPNFPHVASSDWSLVMASKLFWMVSRRSTFLATIAASKGNVCTISRYSRSNFSCSVMSDSLLAYGMGEWEAIPLECSR